MAREVKIVVKNVYVPTEQQQFIVDAATLVRDLKQRVHEQFPGTPLPMHQKLIFGGKICNDNDLLQTILHVNQVVPSDDNADDAPAVVFHLLVTSTLLRSRPHPPPPTPAASSAPAPAASFERQPLQPAAAPATSSTSSDELRSDRRAIDSPRPSIAAAPVASLPALPIASSSPPATASAATTTAVHLQQQESYAQSLLMHHQAVVLAQIQYLEALQRQAQHANRHHQTTPLHPFGHYFHMGMQHQQQQQPQQQPQAAPVAAVHLTPSFAVQVVREVLPLADLRLALKMAFMLFIIGQDTPNDRVLMLAFLSFVSYLHITGILAKIYEVYKRNYARSAPAAAPVNAAAAAPAAPDANAAAGDAPAANGRTRFPTRDFTRVLRISSDRGIVQDIKSFVAAFVLSLVPAWHPQPLHGHPPAAAAAAGGGDVAQMPVQGI